KCFNLYIKSNVGLEKNIKKTLLKISAPVIRARYQNIIHCVTPHNKLLVKV
ncbi:hypothetical protein L9F63_003197, partial [Diploptera punctata]